VFDRRSIAIYAFLPSVRGINGLNQQFANLSCGLAVCAAGVKATTVVHRLGFVQ